MIPAKGGYIRGEPSTSFFLRFSEDIGFFDEYNSKKFAQFFGNNIDIETCFPPVTLNSRFNG